MTATLTRPTSGSALCAPRWATARTPARPTYGPKVAQIAEALGTTLMPWQRQVADVALEVDPATGLLHYRTVILTIPRQQGKTTLLLPVWLQRALTWERQQIAWTMQSAKDAREKWEDEHVPVVMASPLERAVARVRKTNGSEAVLFRNGSIQRLMASTSSSGHGKVLDLGIVDEAFAQTDDRLEQAMRPAMRTRPQPQMWLVSTMGTEESQWFHGWCDAGRASVDAGNTDGPVAYFEWSAAEDADPADPATWWSCMPAMGWTISEATIRQEFEQAQLTPDGVAGFRRASLNQRLGRKRTAPAIDRDVWARLADPGSEWTGDPVGVVDVSPDGRASMVLAGRRADGLRHVELVDARAGLAWIASRRDELSARYGVRRWVRDPNGPAVELVGDWDELKPRQMVESCAGFLRDVLEGGGLRWRCSEDLEPVLLAACDNAARAERGDGSWIWSRRRSGADISPVVAMTIGWAAVDVAAGADPLLAVW